MIHTDLFMGKINTKIKNETKVIDSFYRYKSPYNIPNNFPISYDGFHTVLCIFRVHMAMVCLDGCNCGQNRIQKSTLVYV